jgi:hypothetical protein
MTLWRWPQSNKDQGGLIMKIQIYSQWMEDVFIPARVKQFTKAAKLLGCQSFAAYAGEGSDERSAVGQWLDKACEQVAESVA